MKPNNPHCQRERRGRERKKEEENGSLAEEGERGKREEGRGRGKEREGEGERERGREGERERGTRPDVFGPAVFDELFILVLVLPHIYHGPITGFKVKHHSENTHNN